MASIDTADAVSPLVVAIDVGTSSARALLFDSQARHVRGMQSRAFYQLCETADGGVELDGKQLFDAVVGCLDELYQKAGPLVGHVRAISACTFWHSIMGIDDADNPVTPVYMWADVRSRQAAVELKQTIDRDGYHRRTGCVLHHSYVPAKLRWLRQNDPVTFTAVKRWVSFGDYCYAQLLGSHVTSLSMASASGLFDQHRCEWDDPILDQLGIARSQLPQLGDLETELPGLKSTWAARWPAWDQTRWILSAGDGATSNIGSGCLDQSRVALMVGTSGAMRACWEESAFEIRPGLWCYRADRQRILMGGALSNGGILLTWLQQVFKLPAADAWNRELAGLPADGHGLTVLPFLLGERSPEWADHARGAILGLTLQTTPLQIAQAALEAIACRFALIYRLLSGVIGSNSQIVATGAALLGSPVWIQMMADVLGRQVIASDEEEASSRGTTLLALRALGVISRLDQLPAALGRTFDPDRSRHEIYRETIDRQQKYFELLVGQ